MTACMKSHELVRMIVGILSDYQEAGDCTWPVRQIQTELSNFIALKMRIRASAYLSALEKDPGVLAYVFKDPGVL